MSQDIRSFFSVVSKKCGDKGKTTPKEKPKKTAPRIEDSDDEDFIESTPDQNHSKKAKKVSNKHKIQIINSDSEEETKTKSAELPLVQKHSKISKRKTHIISSDSEEESKPKSAKKSPAKKTKYNEESLKPINVLDVFLNEPVKQSKVEYVPKSEPEKVTKKKQEKQKKKKNIEADVHKDEAFEKTLLDLDDDTILNNMDTLDKTIEEALSHNIVKAVGNVLHREDSEEAQTVGEQKRSEKIVSQDNKEKSSNLKKDELEGSQKKRQRKNSNSAATPNKKPKLEHTDSGIDPDQERYEKKRYSAMLYQKYIHRGGPKHHGTKEVPKGNPDCLKNLTFLRTGVLDSLESEEFENLVKEHGGRVVHGVSKKVNYIVVGDDAGPAKLEKAKTYGIPELSEDDLFDMILQKSGMQPKFCKNQSKDTGMGSDEDELDFDLINDSESTTIKTEESTVAKDSTQKQPSHNEDWSKPQKVESKEDKALKNKLKELVCTKSQDLPQIKRPDNNIPSSCLAWTEKYRPTDLKGIIGQQNSNSNMNKLIKWLKNWDMNQKPENRKRLPKPTPWNPGDGAYFKCALLSGSPGVGKTTTATLVAKELGYDVVEFNASDTRNKKLLHEQVASLLKTKTIAGYASGEKITNRKRVLLMDEVDGMAGNEDRGGIQELISLIKATNIPIICMCNDRNAQKMRTLVTYCFDLKFNKPTLQQIKGALLSICFKEGIQMKPDALEELIRGTSFDIRQTLNHLSMWSAGSKNLSSETVHKESQASHKDTVIGIWEVIKKLFNKSEHENMSLTEKAKLFFFDYSMGPLFVQENYLNVNLSGKSDKERLERISLAAESISMGDLIDTKIRSSNNWALLETQAFYSFVTPGYYMSGTIDRVNFPSWFGKNSKTNKFTRILSELQAHTRTCTSGNKLAMQLDYVAPLRDAVITPLKKEGTNGISKAVQVMKNYSLLREDLTNLIELSQWPGTQNPFNDIDSKIKAAFTRTYNKEVPLLPFSSQTGVSKKRGTAVDEDLLNEDGFIESDPEENDDVSKDAMIKVKAAKGKKDLAKPSTSGSKAKETKKAKPKKNK